MKPISKDNLDYGKILSHNRDVEKPLEAQISEKLERLFENPDEDTWAEIRKLFASEINNLSGSKSRHNDLWNYARNLVEKKAREEAKKVLERMKVRYEYFLNDALVRGYATAVTPFQAWGACIKIMSIMTVIRLDEQWDAKENKVFSFYNGARDKFQKHKAEDEEEEDKVPAIFETMEKMRKKLFSKKKPDRIENILFYSLVQREKKMCAALASNSNTWPEVSLEDTLISPEKCKSLWVEFQSKTLPITQSFIAAQAANTQARRGVFATGLGAAAGAGATLQAGD